MLTLAWGCSIACMAVALDSWFEGETAAAVVLALLGGVLIGGVMLFGA